MLGITAEEMVEQNLEANKAPGQDETVNKTLEETVMTILIKLRKFFKISLSPPFNIIHLENAFVQQIETSNN